MNTILGAVVGAMLAAGVVFLLEHMDDTIKTPDDVSRVLGLSTLGAIGQLAKAEDELVVAARPHSPVAEAFRVLCTNIRARQVFHGARDLNDLFSNTDGRRLTLLVTSPGPAEGKSFIVANLAVVMEQTGLRVVAVDADLRYPRLHRLFGFDSRPEELAQVSLDGSIDGRIELGHLEALSLLPNGAQTPRLSEMLESQNVRKLLDERTLRTDAVLIDCAPVLPVADAAVLAQRVDGVLLVLEAGHTRREDARRAAQSLHQVGANVVGVVLNRVPTQKGSYYYNTCYETNGDGNGRRKQRRGRLFSRRRKAD